MEKNIVDYLLRDDRRWDADDVIGLCLHSQVHREDGGGDKDDGSGDDTDHGHSGIRSGSHGQPDPLTVAVVSLG